MYIIDLHNDEELSSIEGIAGLAKKVVKTKNDSLTRVFQIGIYAYQIIITTTSCNYYSGEFFFFFLLCML